MTNQALAAPHMSGQHEADVLSLLDHIYESALYPTNWPQTVARIADWLGAARALLFTPSASLDTSGFFYAHGVSAEEMSIWSSRYVGQDFWTARALEKGLFSEGAIVRCGDLSSRRELLESEYYREHLVRMDIGWLMTTVLVASPDDSLPPIVLSFYRGTRVTTGFDNAARDRLALLQPHLSRALSLMLRLRRAELQVAASASALDALTFGVALLDHQGRVVQSNGRARGIWLARDGLRLDAHGHMCVEDMRVQRRWASMQQAGLLADAAADGSVYDAELLSVPRVSNRDSYLLQLSPLSGPGTLGRMPGDAHAIVFIIDGGPERSPDATLLMRVYGLSPAEARIARRLGSGGRLTEAADELNLSVNTLKTQLKQVYSKTRCKCRADLTRLILSLGTITAPQTD